MSPFIDHGFLERLKDIMILTLYAVLARPNTEIFCSVLVHICKKDIEKLERV